MGKASANPEALIIRAFTAVGACLLLGAAVLPWWKTIDGTDSLYTYSCRAIAFLLGVLAGIATLRSPERTSWKVAAGLGAFCLPLLFLLYLATVDAKSVSTAIEQTNQAGRLIRGFEATDLNPQVAWTEQRVLPINRVISNDYTLVDGMESVSYFVKPGWWVCLVAGSLILLSVWSGDPAGVRRNLRQWGGWLSLALIVIGLRCFGPIGIASYLLVKARQAEAAGYHKKALARYQNAAYWDKRLDYLVSFHIERGRVLARMGAQEPDYWAVIADSYAATGAFDAAYNIYRSWIPDPGLNPALRLRLTHLLLNRGVALYNADDVRSALDLWQRAISLDPHNIEVMYALAMGYTKTQDYQSAISWWKRLAYANESVGMFKSEFVASVLYRKMITDRAFSGLAWCYYRLGNVEQAMQYDAAAKQQAPGSIEESH